MVVEKKRIELQVNDNDNGEFADHQITKSIKMMTILNALMFKVNLTKGEFNQVQTELLARCAKYFQFQIPKQYKNDIPNLMKQKDFLSLAKDRMMSTLFNHINKANGVTDQLIAVN